MRTIAKGGLLAALMMTCAAPSWADGVGPFVASAAGNAATGSPALVTSADFTAVAVARGSDALENP